MLGQLVLALAPPEGKAPPEEAPLAREAGRLSPRLRASEAQLVLLEG
jgi:hypothetical protein